MQRLITSLSACAALAVAGTTAASVTSFTGFTVERTITTQGNTRYQVFGNWNAPNLVFLNAFNFNTDSGSMNARHQDSSEDALGNPGASWSASFNLAGSIARDNDSWVTASGSGTSAGNDTALDPSFNPSNTSSIPANAGWYDNTPGSPNFIAAGGASGYRMLLLQVVRSGDDAGQISMHTAELAWKVAGTQTPIFGVGSFMLPAPGAMGLLLTGGIVGRRRRA
jgi:hypothetical protein